MSNYQKLIIALCFILNFNDGIDIMMISFASTEIIAEWGLNKTEMGYVFSAALAGMTLGCFLIAPLADTIGRRKTFLWSLAIEAVGMTAIVFSDQYWLLLAMRFVTGLGIGGLLPTMAATAAEFSSTKTKEFNVGLVQGGWPVGAIITGIFCAYFIPLHGWRMAFLIAAIISIMMFVLVYIALPNSEEFMLNNPSQHSLSEINSLRKKMNKPPLKRIPDTIVQAETVDYKLLLNKTYFSNTIKSWVAVFSGFLTLYTILSWIPTIAQDAGLAFSKATYVGVSLNIGAAIGSGLVGYIGSRIGMQKTILGFMILAFVMMIVYGNYPVLNALLFLQVFLIGVFVQGGFNGIYPFLSNIYPSKIRATGIGFSVGFGRFGAILGPFLFGYFLDLGWSIQTLFVFFSVPLLLMGVAVWSVKSYSQA